MNTLPKSAQLYLRYYLSWLIGDEITDVNFSLVPSSYAELLARDIDLDNFNLAEGFAEDFIFDGDICSHWSQCVFPAEADFEGPLAGKLKEPLAGRYPYFGRLVSCQSDDIWRGLGEQYCMVVPVILSGDMICDTQLRFRIRCIWANVCDNDALLGFTISESVEIPLDSLHDE
jgi:hypothetical protein